MSKERQGRSDLSVYDNSWYRPGSGVKRLLWYLCNAIFLNNYWFPFQGVKRFVLSFFGAAIGKGVVIKPKVNIKYPWFLELGDHCWIGEGVWIDNLAQVTIGSHVCISQGALILSGNHNYKKPGFDLMLKPIAIEDGVWLGAKSIVTQGVSCGTHAVLTAGAVATNDLDSYGIYAGNPAQKVKERLIEE
jgi:putative colanic acid biosynthesis acetyltransferase WcaF